MIFRGNILSARPGTRTISKLIPRAASMGATQTFPYRSPEGLCGSNVSRSDRTWRTSRIETGPTEVMGCSSFRSASTPSGLASEDTASPSSQSSHTPQLSAPGLVSRVSMSGSAKFLRWRRLFRSRRSLSASTLAWSPVSRRRTSSSRPRPESLLSQRSRPPMTAASTRSFSQRQGARRVPERTGSFSGTSTLGGGSAKRSSWTGSRAGSGASECRGGTQSTSSSAASGATMGAPRASSFGILRKGKILGEPGGRELLGGAVEQGEEGAARGVGPLRPVLEVGGDSCTVEGVLEERRIDFRGSEQHRHSVERQSVLRLELYGAGKLRCFLRLARSGEHDHVLGPLTSRRRRFSENVSLQIEER